MAEYCGYCGHNITAKDQKKHIAAHVRRGDLISYEWRMAGYSGWLEQLAMPYAGSSGGYCRTCHEKVYPGQNHRHKPQLASVFGFRGAS